MSVSIAQAIPDAVKQGEVDGATDRRVVEAFQRGPEALDALEREEPALSRQIAFARTLWYESLQS
jgi:hypothetical protein